MKLLPNWFRRARKLSESEMAGFLAGPNTASRKNVNADSALQISTVFRCISVLASTLASLPCILYRKLPNGGKERADNHPLSEKLRYQPNNFSTAVTFFESMMISAAMRGNAYANVVWNRAGDVMDLLYLEPDRVQVSLVQNSQGRYEKLFTYTDQHGGAIPFRQNQILHVPALVTRGVIGISPIDLARETMGYAMIAEEHGARSFANANRPVGTVEHPGPGALSPQARDNLKKAFERDAGGENVYGTIVLEHGIKYNPIQLTNEQSQFIESRKFQNVEICRWFGVPPHLAMDLDRATFSNIEHQFLEFIQTCMLPWFVRFQQAIWFTCLTGAEKKNLFVEFLPEAMLKGDTVSRQNAYKTARDGGWMSVDEIRERENMNPLPDGKGQIYLEPLNMKEAGTETPDASPASPAKDPSASPAPSPSQDDADSPSRKAVNELVERFRPLIEGAMRRAQVKEIKAVRDKLGKPEALAVFIRNHEKLLQEVLMPFVQTMAELRGIANPADFATCMAREFASTHAAQSRAETDHVEDWETNRISKDVEQFCNQVRINLYLEDWEAARPARNIVQLQPIVNVKTEPSTTNVTVEQPSELEGEMVSRTDEAGNRVYKFKVGKRA